MQNIHQRLTSQQILDRELHPIQQPDTEEARQARVAQRFRIYFLLDAEKKAGVLGKKAASPARTERARLLLPQVEAAHALMLAPQNRFLIRDHACQVDGLLADLYAMVA